MSFDLVHTFLQNVKEKDTKFKESDFEALILVVQIFTWGTENLNPHSVGVVNECMEGVDPAMLLGQAVDALLVMIAVAEPTGKKDPKHKHEDKFYELNMRVFLYTKHPNMVWKENVVEKFRAMFQ